MESNADLRRPVAGPIHTIGFLIINVAWALPGAFTTREMRASASSHLILFYTLMMISEWLLLAYVVWGVRRQGGSLRDLIGGNWSRGKDFWRDVRVAAGFWLVSIICLAALRFAIHGDFRQPGIRFLAPHGAVQITLWILLSSTAGFCEETVFRGYLQRQCMAMSGSVSLGILLSAVVFGGAHIYQGAKQTIILGVYGAMFGTLAHFRRSLRPVMMAHAWQDTISGLLLRFLPN